MTKGSLLLLPPLCLIVCFTRHYLNHQLNPKALWQAFPEPKPRERAHTNKNYRDEKIMAINKYQQEQIHAGVTTSSIYSIICSFIYFPGVLFRLCIPLNRSFRSLVWEASLTPPARSQGTDGPSPPSPACPSDAPHSTEPRVPMSSFLKKHDVRVRETGRGGQEKNRGGNPISMSTSTPSLPPSLLCPPPPPPFHPTHHCRRQAALIHLLHNLQRRHPPPPLPSSFPLLQHPQNLLLPKHSMADISVNHAHPSFLNLLPVPRINHFHTPVSLLP